MRILPATALIGVLLIATASSGLEAPPPTYASTRRPPPAGVLSSLRALPDAFWPRLRPAWRPPFRPSSRDCRALFDAAAGRFPRDGRLDVAAGTFDGVLVGQFAAVGLAEYPGGLARHRFGELRAALAGCTRADGGTPAAADLLTAAEPPVEVPAGAGEAAARVLTGRVGGYPYEMHVVVAGTGGTVLALVHGGIAPPDMSGTVELTRSLLREVGNLEP